MEITAAVRIIVAVLLSSSSTLGPRYALARTRQPSVFKYLWSRDDASRSASDRSFEIHQGWLFKGKIAASVRSMAALQVLLLSDTISMAIQPEGILASTVWRQGGNES